MKPKFNIVKALFMAMAMVAATWFPAEAAEKSGGITAGVNTNSGAPLAGLYFGMGIGSHLRVTPSIFYQFERKSTDAFMLNIDVESPWTIAGTPVKVYPLAGVSVSRWNRYDLVGGDAKSHADRLGLNLGGGVEWRPSSLLHLKVFVEGKYGFAKNYGAGFVTAGIGYIF